MARARDNHHYGELVTKRRVKPVAPHDPANRLIFSPTGVFLGFAGTAAAAAASAALDASPASTEAEPQKEDQHD